MKYSTIISLAILIVNAIIVYFGRIFFPRNFQPETISFFENYWVLTLGMCFVIGIFTICVLALLWLYSSLIEELKTLFKRWPTKNQ